MRNIVTLLSLMSLLAACSSHKYTYYFDHYDYNSGKKETVQEKQVTHKTTPNQIEDKTIVASSSEGVLYTAERNSAPVISNEEAIAKFNSLSKAEKKEVKKEVKRELKKYIKENKNVAEAQRRSGLSGDLKLAAIFGIVGIVLLVLLGEVLWLGTIAILIGLFFLVRYLINH